MAPSKRSAYARGYRAVSVQSEEIRAELHAGALANGYPSIGDYLIYLHRTCLALARGKGFATAQDWLAHVEQARTKKP